jgi:integrase
MTGVKCVLDQGDVKKDERNNRGRQTAMGIAEDWRNSLIQADEESEARKVQIEQDAERRNKEKTVAEYARGIVDRKEGSVEKSTIKGYRFNAKQVSEAFPGVLLTELTTDMVSDWKKKLTESYSPVTAKKTYNFLKACMDEALEEGLIERTPFTRSIKAPKLGHKKPNALDADGRKHVIALLSGKDSRVAVAAQIALYTGMRRGEICALTWQNVTIERDAKGVPCGGRITVANSIGVAEGTYIKSTKTDRVRRVPIHAELAKSLAARKASMKEEALSFGVPFNESFYVLGNVSGEYCNPDVISREWGNLARFHKLKGTQGRICTFHDLRHTFATAAFRNGAKVKSVSDILGHANAAMTLNVYTDSENDMLEETVKAVGDSMQGGKVQADVITLDKTGTD